MITLNLEEIAVKQPAHGRDNLHERRALCGNLAEAPDVTDASGVRRCQRGVWNQVPLASSSVTASLWSVMVTTMPLVAGFR